MDGWIDSWSVGGWKKISCGKLKIETSIIEYEKQHEKDLGAFFATVLVSGKRNSLENQIERF